ncbi:MAG: hypothetical protein J6P71_02490, partial [Oscillospiraceae bacterium]|nr:hypothetical protein [Oscillospiraceae bacterium]
TAKRPTLALLLAAAALLVAFLFISSVVIVPASVYRKADSLYKAGRFDEAAAKFELLKDYRDSEARLDGALNASAYEKAEKAYAAGDYGAAFLGFYCLGDYLDAVEKAGTARSEWLLSAHAGDAVTFGRYGPAGFPERKEPVEWVVAEIDGTTIMLVSRYALTSMYFSESREDVTWETSRIRKWLNGEFFAGTFSEAEKSLIGNGPLPAGVNPAFPVPTAETADAVFLLSIDEAARCFASDAERQCGATEDAERNGTVVYRKNDQYYGNCTWWLRSPGKDAQSAAVVGYDGSIQYVGEAVGFVAEAVRPAIRIELGP